MSITGLVILLAIVLAGVAAIVGLVYRQPSQNIFDKKPRPANWEQGEGRSSDEREASD